MSASDPKSFEWKLGRAKDALEALRHVGGTLGREDDKDSEEAILGLANIAASALEAAEARIAALTEVSAGYHRDWLREAGHADKNAARIAALEAENGALREKVEQLRRALVSIILWTTDRTVKKIARAALRQAEEKSDG